MVNSKIFKIALAIFVVTILYTSVHADDYRILMLNTETISIGNKTLKKGDIFSDGATIKWANDKQAVKVFNMTSKKIMVLAAKQLKAADCSSVLDYVIYTKRMSVRNDAESYSHSEQYLLDTLKISAQIDPTQVDHIELFYLKAGKKISKTLECDEEGMVIIPYNIFGTIRQRTVKVNIFCKMKDNGELICLIKDMTIYLL